MNIQEVCKSRKEELKLTYQEISDASGVPLFSSTAPQEAR